jgi:hypothetical protein
MSAPFFGQLRLAQRAVNVLDVQAEQPGDGATATMFLEERQLDFVLAMSVSGTAWPVAVAFGRTQLGRVVDQDAARRR